MLPERLTLEYLTASLGPSGVSFWSRSVGALDAGRDKSALRRVSERKTGVRQNTVKLPSTQKRKVEGGL
ncbi:unnamed protein product, partial [Iphiclides podalirius]